MFKKWIDTRFTTTFNKKLQFPFYSLLTYSIFFLSSPALQRWGEEVKDTLFKVSIP